MSKETSFSSPVEHYLGSEGRPLVQYHDINANHRINFNPNYFTGNGNTNYWGNIDLQTLYSLSHSLNSNNYSKISSTQICKSNKKMQTPVKCIPCEKTFVNKKQLENHYKQHVSCDICTFSASKKVLQTHIDENHSDMILKPIIMNSEDEIKKWREERRKNYPTNKNIINKKEKDSDNEEPEETKICKRPLNCEDQVNHQMKKSKTEICGESRDIQNDEIRNILKIIEFLVNKNMI